MPLISDKTIQDIKLNIENIYLEKQFLNNKLFRNIIWIVVIGLIICLFVFVLQVKKSIVKKRIENTEELTNIVKTIQDNKLRSSSILNTFINAK
jgi:hypothetical protein